MVVGKILGMAGKTLAKKFLSKKGKKATSTFLARKSVLSGLGGAIKKTKNKKD